MINNLWKQKRERELSSKDFFVFSRKQDKFEDKLSHRIKDTLELKVSKIVVKIHLFSPF